MKLYTEEQVRQMLEVCIDSDLYEHILTFEDILKTQKPIELPSDEEINEMGIDVIIYNDTKRGWFVEGLKFMRDKIQGNERQDKRTT